MGHIAWFLAAQVLQVPVLHHKAARDAIISDQALRLSCIGGGVCHGSIITPLSAAAHKTPRETARPLPSSRQEESQIHGQGLGAYRYGSRRPALLDGYSKSLIVLT